VAVLTRYSLGKYTIARRSAITEVRVTWRAHSTLPRCRGAGGAGILFTLRIRARVARVAWACDVHVRVSKRTEKNVGLGIATLGRSNNAPGSGRPGRERGEDKRGGEGGARPRSDFNLNLDTCPLEKKLFRRPREMCKEMSDRVDDFTRVNRAERARNVISFSSCFP